jgi:NitT/TauT family transport system permease protein
MKSESEILEVKGKVDTLGTSEKSSFRATGYLKHLTHKYTAIIIFFILWQVLPTIGVINPIFVPTPTTIAVTIWDLIISGELITDILASLWRVLAAFSLSLVVGLSIGLLLGGFFRSVEKAINPLLQLISQANPFTLLPVFIAFLGIGEISKIAFIYFVTQWPIIFNTVTGITNVDPVLVKLARTAGLSKFQIFWKVLLPASLPTVFTGIRMAAVFSLFMLIGAEMLGSTAGLGYLVMQAEGVMNYPVMYAAIVVVALFGIIFMYVITLVEKRLTGWKEDIAF